MSKEIDINNEEQILKECDFNYYYNSVCSRELCMFFNDIAKQDSHFDKRQAYIDLGRIGIIINKQYSEIADLEAKLAEKDAELKNIVEGLWTRKWANKYYEMRRKEQPKLLFPDSDEVYEKYFELKQQLAEKEKEIIGFECVISAIRNSLKEVRIFKVGEDQDKISFCIEHLEKVKDWCKEWRTEDEFGVFTINVDDELNTEDNLLNFIDNQIKQLKEGE